MYIHIYAMLQLWAKVIVLIKGFLLASLYIAADIDVDNKWREREYRRMKHD